MPSIQLNDQVFQVALRRAAEAGYTSVEAYVADVVVHDDKEPDNANEIDNFDYLFVPTVIEDLDRISADIKAGCKTYTADEVRKHFENKRTAWLAKHTS